MSSQGKRSNQNGQALQQRCLAAFSRLDIDAKAEYATGIPNALNPTQKLRCDIYLPDCRIIVECKGHSGQPGSIYQKIPFSFLTYRSTRTPVVFILDGRFPTGQIEQLRIAASLISPLIEIITEDQIGDYCWTSDQL